ncbi:response regulator with metal dependent phosphohydrolase activity (two-component) [Azotobacter vinelandii CA]|uniref:Response regulator with metal dependent phosphohydrolase activity (Two-component) n=1 Tax=Azotobacter vinelandii (strain DJ / ATCC BAA-1303) TaxID=322710 RepID=C1DLF9_AZOVD|nr:two-component system response regulator [Azotobacter vinelandii]ACO81152.1 response regulator with metal dependent phosphohydrolase activity (two-component) [Azotobacter vinelandii DJ]AGK14155.1 response regulator with metal dependent phosphohydrolase activity (two-component) [Azotobacter vinelandii CA]WKN21898.1 two-component system response regulator [Azotobacter vinelandii]SFX66017.1 putative two-component system response regulator [Azotobacter vinelandii]GLK57907.1 two-component system 
MKATILVVDDVPENIDIFVEILAPHHRTKVALNGERALRIARSDNPPDLILLDVMMPGLSGYQVCERLKADPDTRAIPVIFVTAMSETADEQRGLELGAVDYITKPISPPIALARVRTHLALHRQRQELARQVEQRTAELLRTRQQIVRRLSRAAEFRDNETGNHIVRMSHIARLIAQAAGMGAEFVETLFNAAPMHDIGKIGIPDSILFKSGRLEPEEWAIMRRHTEIGAKIIGRHDDDLLKAAHSIALHHHEKWDGSGYPQGLGGEEIPLMARIAAVADVFDALTSARPYKKAWPLEEAVGYIEAQAGTHFDPALIGPFRRSLGEIARIVERYADHQGPCLDFDP